MKHAETQGKHAAPQQAEAAQDVKSQDAHSKKLQGSHVGKSQGVHDKTPQGSRGVNSKGAPAGKPQGAHAAEPLFEGEGQSAAMPLGIGAFILAIVLIVNVLIPWASTNPWENISISLPQFAQPQANDASDAADNEQASDKKSYTLTTKSLDAIPASTSAPT